MSFPPPPPRRPPPGSPRSRCAPEFAVPGDIVAGPDGAMYTGRLEPRARVCRITDTGRVRFLRRRPAAPPASRPPTARCGSPTATQSSIVRLGLDGSQTFVSGHAGRVPERHRARVRRRAVVHRAPRGRDRRLGVDGEVTEYPLPTPAPPTGIAAGPDGALWFTEPAANRIGRITTAGDITEFALPTADSECPARSPPARTARSGSPSATRTRSAA